MKNVILTIACLLFWTMSTVAQTGNEIGENSELRDRIYTGGNFGFSSTSQFTYLEVAPIIGYRVTNNFTAGTGFTYRYLRYKIYSPEITTSVFGTSLFARYNIFKSYFAQMEYEFLRYDRIISATEKNKEGYNSFLVGGGYSEPLGGNAALNFTILYNLSYSLLTPGPYDSPWIIRGGVTFGF